MGEQVSCCLTKAAPELGGGEGTRRASKAEVEEWWSDPPKSDGRISGGEKRCPL